MATPEIQRAQRASKYLQTTTVIATVLVSLGTAWLHRSSLSVSDDAYITYRYAQHLANGDGFVFYPDAPPVLGTSTPLYTALLAAGARLGEDIPTLSLFLGAMACAVVLGIVVLIAWDLGVPAAGVATVLTWNTSPLPWASLAGMETPVSMALILGAVWAARRGSGLLALGSAALAVLARIDGLAVLAAIATVLVLTRRWSWRAAAPAALILAASGALAIYWFGSPLPNSGLAKLVHEDGISGRFNPASWPFLQLVVPATQLLAADARFLGPLMATVVGCALLTCVATARSSPTAPTLVLWLAIYIAAFRLLGLPDFPWYYTPVALVACFFVWAAIEIALAAGRRRFRRRCGRTIPAGVVVLALASAVAAASPTLGRAQPYDWPAQQAAGEWLRQHARSDATVAAYEIGKLSYFSQLRVIDILGLTEPAARQFVKERDYAWAVRRAPTYVFANEDAGWVITRVLFRSCEFVLQYRPVARFPFRPGLDYVIYDRSGPSDGPSPLASPGGGVVEWLDPYFPPAVPRAAVGAYSIVVRNSSSVAWEPEGQASVSISYHWLTTDGVPAVWDREMTPVPCAVGPGQSVLVSARVKAPVMPGAYLLRWGVVHSTQGWLGDHDLPAPVTPVSVW